MKHLTDTATLICVVALLACCSARLQSQDVLRITETTMTQERAFRIQLVAPAGELLLQTSRDMISWLPVLPLGTNGGVTELRQPTSAAATFFRVQSIPDSDDDCLAGPMAQALIATVPYGDLQTAFGLAATPPPSPITLVRELATADRDARRYAAAIAVLCIIAHDLTDTINPSPSVEAIVAALASDLASGNLDGRDSSDNRIPIGTTGVLLKEFTSEDLAAVAARLDGELSGLRDVEVQPSGGGKFTTTAPACWNTFYWGSSEWQ